jgi:serine/threonine-protein kinase
VPAGVVAGILIGALGAAALRLGRVEPAPARPVTRFAVPLPEGGRFRDNVSYPLILTRDGRRLVMNVSVGGIDRVMVRTMDQIHPQAVQGLEGTIGSIFLSPDGEWIGYNDSKGLLRKMRISGGPPSTIAETGITSGGWQGATWGTAGTIVFSTVPNRALMEVAEAGGLPKPRTTAAEGESHERPHFLPDGRALLFVVRSAERPRIAYLADGASDYTPLLEGADPRYLPSGHLLFTREDSVWAVAFDAVSGRIAGDPVPVLEGVRTEANGVAKMSVSAEGTLAYVPGAAVGLRTIVRVDRQGREQPLPGLAPDRYQAIRISPDGTKMAFVAGRPPDVWTYDLSRGTATRVTTGDAPESMPVWSPDGTRLIFTTVRNGESALYSQNADGTGQAEQFFQAAAAAGPPPVLQTEGWSRDGRTVVVQVDRGGTFDIAMINLAPELRFAELVATPAIQGGAAISPDGRWLAYLSNVSGVFEVYVERFPELGDRQRISTNGGFSPRWSADGRELFFQSIDGRQIMSVAIAGGQKLAAGVPAVVFEGEYVPTAATVRPFEVGADGQFFLLKVASAASNKMPTIQVVQSWGEELKRLVPPPGSGR